MEAFNQKIYEKLKEVPKGKVVTYKELAIAINSKAYRAVGTVMKKNKDPINIPCYKVIKNSGEIGGYCGKLKGEKIKEKIKLLEKDGVTVRNEKVDKKYFYYF